MTKITNKDIAMVYERKGRRMEVTAVFVCVKTVAQDEDYPTFALLHEAKTLVEAKRWVRVNYPHLEWAGSPQEVSNG